MRLSKITILILVVLILLAISVAKISNLITVKYDPESKENEKVKNSEKEDFLDVKSIGSSFDHLMWFIQISDIHLSLFHDLDRFTDFRDFCNSTVETIQPAVVVASGDLTDSKGEDSIATKQYQEEWLRYSAILAETNVTKRTLWLDIRGNHDNFNVPSITKFKSFYHEYSIQGKLHNRSYMYTITKNSEKYSSNPPDRYSFIAVDAALDPGPKAPWNFIGKITSHDLKVLEQFEKDSTGSKATVWFGHYPTSCIMSPELGIRDLMKSATAYLCGHLHTVYGAIPKMYTLQHDGFLELELGDFKENRMFRVAAFDHGLFSFIDVKHGEWPIVLVTNPKDTLFNIPQKENVQWILNSTHIRVLVFSLNPLKTVSIKVDEEDWVTCKNVKGPLYVAEWNPHKYSSGAHQIKVNVKENEGRETNVVQSFALDGTRYDFRLFSRIALMIDAATVSMGVFATAVITSISPLVFTRILHVLVKANKVSFPVIKSKWCRNVLRKIWITSTINKLFFPLTLCSVYLIIGPWYFGYLLDDYFGVAFAWGTFVDGHYLPGAFSYVFHGCIFVIWLYIPFTIALCHSVDLRFKMICLNKNYSQIWNNLPIIIILLFEVLVAYLVYQFVGTTALFLGPLQLFSIVFVSSLLYVSSRLSLKDFLEAKRYWKVKNNEDTTELFQSVSNQNHSHNL